MARPLPPAPRKRPKQERSRALTDALLEATARILRERGSLEGVSTNAIAKVAGVSVGSLYQYFPHKEALAAALVERKLELDLAEAAALLGAQAGAPLEAQVRAMVDLVVGLHQRDRGLLRAVLTLAPRVGLEARVRAGVAQLLTGVEALLAAHRARLRPTDLGLAAFLVGRGVEELVHAALFERPELLEDPRFAEELTHLALAYLGVAPGSRQAGTTGARGTRPARR